MLWLLITPLLSALLLAFIGMRPVASLISIGASLIALIFAIFLAWQVNQQGAITWGREWFYLDHLSAFLVILTTFIGFTTAIYNATYLVNERWHHKLTKKGLRFYHSLYQFFLFTMLLILETNNLGILWVAMEGATLATVLLVSLYRTPQSLEAAWKYLILCGVGIAQALLGTILLYFAAEKVIGLQNALFWTQLHAVSSMLSAHIASLAFVFLFIGYGTKVGFVPLHNWLPDAHGEGPAPVSALLSGLLLNMAFYAILRCKIIVDSVTGSTFTNHFFLGFGLLNVLVAAFFLLRQREIKRLLAYSSIEHMGLVTFAFGLNTPLAVFAGLFHMAMHSLSKTAAFFSAGQAIQVRGTPFIEPIYSKQLSISQATKEQVFATVYEDRSDEDNKSKNQNLKSKRGLINVYPLLGWSLLLCSIALLGIPPSALFTSEFLILFTAMKQYPLLAILLFIGLGIAFAAFFRKTQILVFGKTFEMLSAKKEILNFMPICLHLILVLILGLWVPAYLVSWFHQIFLLMQGLS